MRVSISTLDAFITELQDAARAGRPLYMNTIRWELHHEYLNAERISWRLGVIGTALIAGSGDDAGFYLAQYTEQLGVENVKKEKEFEAKAATMRQRVEALAHENEWIVRDGRWEA